MKKVFFLLVTFLFVCVNAQVGIGTTNPDASAILDVDATNKGVLVPRVAIADLNTSTPVTTPVESLLVYNTTVATGVGFHYWDGVKWMPLAGSAAADNDWTVVGDDMYNANSGNVGVGTNAPTAKLHIEDTGVASSLLNQDFEGGFAPFTTGGSASWAIQTSNVNGGVNAAGSGSISHSQSTYMDYNVIIPAGGATLSFYYKVSSETNFDKLRFYIDGVEQNNWSGNIPFTQVTYPLVAGTYALQWSYTKDLSMSSWDDAAYVDDILITTAVTGNDLLRIVDGNEAAGKTLVSDANGNASWQQLTNTNISNLPQIASFQGMKIPICDSVNVGSTGSYSVIIDGFLTTVNWEILVQNTAVGTTKIDVDGDEVLLAPYNPERLQVRYDFSPDLPFIPNSLIFMANNSSSFPDTFSLNYASKSASSIKINITRTDVFGDDGGASYKCWEGQFYFDVFMTD